MFYLVFSNRRPLVGDEGNYAAAQATIFSGEPGERDFQISLYESNDYYFDTLTSISGALAKLARPVRRFSGLVNAGIGFLDSSVSGNLVLRYNGGRTYVTRTRGNPRRHASEVVRRVVRALKGTGVLPVPGLVLIPPPGCGYHSGSSLPMGSDILDFEGRLRAVRRIHVVDASALPKIWAGSHTFTAMANAYRIGRLDA